MDRKGIGSTGFIITILHNITQVLSTLYSEWFFNNIPTKSSDAMSELLGSHAIPYFNLTCLEIESMRFARVVPVVSWSIESWRKEISHCYAQTSST